MKKSFAHICLVVTFLGFSVAYANSAVTQTLASGSFRCEIVHIDPPSGVPRASAYLHFSDVLGMVGSPPSTSIRLGGGLEANCQGLTETMFSLAQNQSCTVSAIQNTQEQGGNYIRYNWEFDMLCDGKQTTVVNAISSLSKEMLTTPLVTSQRILIKSNEMLDNSAN